jgi:hypothetical protein
LLANKAEVDAKGHDGLTPLYMATLFGHAKVMELLIARGADVNVKDKDGKTPLQLVTAAGRKELVELLVAHGARESREEENQGLPDIVCRFRWKRLEVSPDGIVRDADGKVTKLAVGNTDIEMQTDVVGFEYWYVVVFTKRYGKLRVKMNSDLTGRVVLTPDQKAAFMKLGK